MLNNTALPQTENRSRFSFQKLKGKKRKLFILISAVALATVLAYITTKNQTFLSNPFKPQVEEKPAVVDSESGKLTTEFIENIENVTVEEVKEASESSGINILESADISNEETSAQIYEQLGNKDPVNNIISYSEGGLSLSYVEIKQGDLVTWSNDSTVPMNIVGEGWQNNIPIDPGDKFSYGFLYLGEYKYKINDSTEGIVNVIK